MQPNIDPMDLKDIAAEDDVNQSVPPLDEFHNFQRQVMDVLNRVDA